MVAHAYNPITWVVEAGGSRVYLQLHREFEGWLEYVRPDLKQTNQKKTTLISKLSMEAIKIDKK